MSVAIGLTAEAMASRYLEQRGLVLLHRNFRCRRGEIDLIMRDKEYVVFVEVRLRQHQHFGGAAVTVDRYKQKHLITAATYFLQQQGWLEKYPCRFDVVTLSDITDTSKIEWLKDAFQVNYRC